MTIIIEDQEVIDGQYKTSKVFFDKILGMSVDECLITDNSCLSDFVGSGDFYFDAERDLKEIYDAWDVFVLNKIQEVYQLKLEKTGILLVQIFDQIENRSKLQ